MRDLVLSQIAQDILRKKIHEGAYISAQNKKEKTNFLVNSYYIQSKKEIDGIYLDKQTAKILCSLIYWCEGSKNIRGGVIFTNSDPSLVKIFLKLLRASFFLDEKKFRICIHLHDYHNSKKQRIFWANETKIPEIQFIKPYRKLNTGKRIKEGYNGCVSVRYHDTVIARKLLMHGKAFLENVGV